MAPTTALYRCVGCAGPAPADEVLTAETPAPVDRSALLARIQQLLRTGDTDWKRAQGNDR